MTDTTKVFDFGNMTKDGAVEIARHLGIKKDWARTTKIELLAMMRTFSVEKLLAAARSACEESGEDFADEDWLVDAEEVTPVDELLDDAPVIEEAPKAKAAPQAAAAAPDVSQVATLLAQLLATGKAGVNADEVRNIVMPMMVEQTQLTATMVCKAVEAAIKNIPAREILVKSERAEVKIEGLQHHNFEQLLHVCAARQPDGHRLNVWLYGPPGTGKTTAARNVSKALGLPFHCNGALSTKYELTGFIDAGGTYQTTEFRKAWEHGGVYLFDEIDGSVPAAVVAFNAALANGVMAFPDGMVERHQDCVIVAAANTVHGATAEFTGRMKLDVATIDRFVMMDWPIDEAMELAMSGNEEWARTVQRFRRTVLTKGVKVAITPRATMYGSSLLAQGLPMDTVRSLVLRKGMTDQQWAMCA